MLLVSLQVIATAATVVTVYLAQQTVREARTSRRENEAEVERRRKEWQADQKVRRLERATELGEHLFQYYSNGDMALAVQTQTSLEVLSRTMFDDLPITVDACSMTLGYDD